MPGLLREFVTFLRERPLAWLAPIVLFYGLLAWLAHGEADVPTETFVYRIQ